jgi:hypothetical protein
MIGAYLGDFKYYDLIVAWISSDAPIPPSYFLKTLICTRTETLPELPNLDFLVCKCHVDLKTFPNLKYLNYSNLCDYVPRYDNLQEMVLCEMYHTYGTYPKLKKLLCYNNFTGVWPDMPNLKKIKFGWIKCGLPVAPALKKLAIRRLSTNIVPFYPNLQCLKISDVTCESIHIFINRTLRRVKIVKTIQINIDCKFPALLEICLLKLPKNSRTGIAEIDNLAKNICGYCGRSSVIHTVCLCVGIYTAGCAMCLTNVALYTKTSKLVSSGT